MELTIKHNTDEELTLGRVIGWYMSVGMFAMKIIKKQKEE
jgi:hypothetical protein